jgi:regulator of protease activity HflC (stomatin/prohibitin superfamily)
MKADHLSFKRAASVAMLGTAIQVAFTLILLLYGLYGKDFAAFGASLFSLVGVFVWLVLALLFDQHRRERVEAMEADALAEEAATSVFEEGAADLRIASKRLATWYKFVIPVASLLIGGALLVLGYLGLKSPNAFVRPGGMPEAAYPGWAIALGLIIAFVGFVFARFVSGMAKQPIWANLRGGAAYAVGAAIVGLAMAVAQFIEVAGSDSGRRVLSAAVPILILGLGVEVFLSFLIDLYRPRKKGVFPRPAFDSRVLGLLSAPDRIARSIGEALDYQFGFGVQETWFYRLLLRWWPGLVAAGVLVVWLLSIFAVVAPDQRGMILRFGKVVRADVGPGLHVKMPWPIDRVALPEVTERTEAGQVRVIGYTATGVRTMQLGTPAATGDGPVLWTNEHTAEEIVHICQPSEDLGVREGGSRDLALVAVEVPLAYSVTDPLLFDQLGPPGIREEILRVVGQRAVTAFLSSVQIDQVLGADRDELAGRLMAEVEEAFGALNPGADGVARGAGVEVLSVTVAHMHPPRDIAPKFEQVVIAQQHFDAKIEVARGEEVEALAGVAGSVAAANAIVAALDEYDSLRNAGADEAALAAQEAVVDGLMSAAQGEAATVLAAAQAERWRKHMGAWSESIRYQGMVASYTAAPLVYRAGLYFDALRESLADSRIFLVSSEVPNLHIRGELQSETTTINMFQKDPNE